MEVGVARGVELREPRKAWPSRRRLAPFLAWWTTTAADVGCAGPATARTSGFSRMSSAGIKIWRLPFFGPGIEPSVTLRVTPLSHYHIGIYSISQAPE